jgi:A/G-specific adenine glycosylase
MADVESVAYISGDIARTLLHWYDRHGRVLPWRSPPGNPAPTPYRVWLSEIMLQQTTVAAVIPYYARFLARWPDVAALAAADDAELMAAWAGLGYYARARNLLACARTVIAEHGGRFPETETGLRALPGIGNYTAAAIAAIAFGVRAVVVDANVERVVARLFTIETPLPAAKPEIHAACDLITPEQRSGDFAQAMMDLGATVCTPRNPDCHACPLATHCMARKAGNAERLPIKPVKATKPQRTGTAFWIEKDDHVWLVQRSAKGMLAGMRALPDDGWMAQADGDGQPPIEAVWQQRSESISHVFTHFGLTLKISQICGPFAETALPTGIWWPINTLDSAGLPTLFMKAAKAVSAIRER